MRSVGKTIRRTLRNLVRSWRVDVLLAIHALAASRLLAGGFRRFVVYLDELLRGSKMNPALTVVGDQLWKRIGESMDRVELRLRKAVFAIPHLRIGL